MGHLRGPIGGGAKGRGKEKGGSWNIERWDRGKLTALAESKVGSLFWRAVSISSANISKRLEKQETLVEFLDCG